MDIDPPALPLAYKDSSTGLKIFGLLTIFGGLLCLALACVAFLTLRFAPAAQTPSPRAIQFFVPLEYGLIGLIEIWLGIGSIMARRWARALLLIYSWAWLILGSLVMIAAVFLLPRVWTQIAASQPRSGPMQNAQVVGLITAAIVGLLFVMIPAIWIWFYGRSNVKLTCEARDPQPRWTDRCPLPVLAVCIWLFFCAVIMLIMPFLFRGVFPFFGMLLSGAAGFVIYALMAAVYLYCALTLYRLQRAGWWVLFALLCLSVLSRTMTWLRHDLADYYRAIGYGETEIARLTSLPFMHGHALLWISLVCTIPILAYTIFIRRYLRA